MRSSTGISRALAMTARDGGEGQKSPLSYLERLESLTSRPSSLHRRETSRCVHPRRTRASMASDPLNVYGMLRRTGSVPAVLMHRRLAVVNADGKHLTPVGGQIFSARPRMPVSAGCGNLR